MELAKKYRWAKVGFILMLLLNVGILVAIWAIRPPFDYRSGERRDRVQRFMDRQLNLSEAQQQTFQELRRHHFRERRKISSNIHELRSRYFSLFTESRSDSVNVELDSLAKQIGRQQARLEKEMFEHLSGLREVLDEDQKKRFARMVEKIFRRWEHNRHPRRSVPNSY
jgi:Spy/CpxP family protein refolding chaperone